MSSRHFTLYTSKGATYQIPWSRYATLGQIKLDIQSITGIPVNSQELFNAEKSLDAEQSGTLIHTLIDQNETMFVYYRGEHNFFKLTAFIKYSHLVELMKKMECKAKTKFVTQIAAQFPELTSKLIIGGLIHYSVNNAVTQRKCEIHCELQEFEKHIDTAIRAAHQLDIAYSQTKFHALPAGIIQHVARFMTTTGINALTRLNRFYYISIANAKKNNIISVISDPLFMEKQNLHNFNGNKILNVLTNIDLMRNIEVVHINYMSLRRFLAPIYDEWSFDIISSHSVQVAASTMFSKIRKIFLHDVHLQKEDHMFVSNMLVNFQYLKELSIIDSCTLRAEDLPTLPECILAFALNITKLRIINLDCAWFPCSMRTINSIVEKLQEHHPQGFWSDMKHLKEIVIIDTRFEFTILINKLLPPEQITHLTLHLRTRRQSKHLHTLLGADVTRGVYRRLEQLSVENVSFNSPCTNGFLQLLLLDSKSLTKFAFKAERDQEAILLLGFMSQHSNNFKYLNYLKTNGSDHAVVSQIVKLIRAINKPEKHTINKPTNNNNKTFMLEFQTVFQTTQPLHFEQLTRVFADYYSEWVLLINVDYNVTKHGQQIEHVNQQICEHEYKVYTQNIKKILPSADIDDENDYTLKLMICSDSNSLIPVQYRLIS